jgi:hypothetical protein
MSDLHEGLTVEFVRACFRYDPHTGKLFWKVRATGRKPADIGDEAGGNSHHSGYSRVTVFGRTIMAHRVAWAIHYGSWPEDGLDIDHINRITDDNRIANLRLATRSQNLGNAGPNGTPKTSGFKGVGWMAKKGIWRARLGADHLGVFETEEAAARAYDIAAKAKWGEYALTNFTEEKELV